jgi:hypothetical protein
MVDHEREADAERRRKAAILRAVGLEDVPAEQRELALAIANNYGLDLMLKHLVLIDGRPYITRDALLWVAHRSGHFDGIQTTEPIIKEFPGLGQCWWSEATVWRDDMSHPFTYGGRYPVAGQNKRYGPEMAIKVAECMTLRRAFNVSAPTVEERWSEDAEDAVMNSQDVQPPKDLKALVAAKVDNLASVDAQAAEDEKVLGPVPAPLQEDEDTGGRSRAQAEAFTRDMNALAAEDKVTMKAPPKTPTDTSAVVKDTRDPTPVKEAAPPSDFCNAASPYREGELCDQIKGHTGLHRVNNSTWADPVK